MGLGLSKPPRQRVVRQDSTLTEIVERCCRASGVLPSKLRKAARRLIPKFQADEPLIQSDCEELGGQIVAFLLWRACTKARPFSAVKREELRRDRVRRCMIIFLAFHLDDQQFESIRQAGLESLEGWTDWKLHFKATKVLRLVDVPESLNVPDNVQQWLQATSPDTLQQRDPGVLSLSWLESFVSALVAACLNHIKRFEGHLAAVMDCCCRLDRQNTGRVPAVQFAAALGDKGFPLGDVRRVLTKFLGWKEQDRNKRLRYRSVLWSITVFLHRQRETQLLVKKGLDRDAVLRKQGEMFVFDFVHTLFLLPQVARECAPSSVESGKLSQAQARQWANDVIVRSHMNEIPEEEDGSFVWSNRDDSGDLDHRIGSIIQLLYHQGLRRLCRRLGIDTRNPALKLSELSSAPRFLCPEGATLVDIANLPLRCELVNHLAVVDVPEKVLSRQLRVSIQKEVVPDCWEDALKARVRDLARAESLFSDLESSRGEDRQPPCLTAGDVRADRDRGKRVQRESTDLIHQLQDRISLEDLNAM